MEIKSRPNNEKRKWVIIEDDPGKVLFLIKYIVKLAFEDEIHWIYAEKAVNIISDHPFLQSKKTSDSIYESTVVNSFIGQDYTRQKEQKKIYYYKADNKEKVYRFFKEYCQEGNSIYLLDKELMALGGKNHDFNKDVSKFFLSNPKKKLLATIITSQVNVARVKNELVEGWPEKMKEKVIYNADEWLFLQKTLDKDCSEVIEKSIRAWKEIYEDIQITLPEFWNSMSKFNQQDLHNLNANKKKEYIKSGLWCAEWNMPIQYKYLIQYIGYDKIKFLEDFKLKDSSGRFIDGSMISESLKSFGTKDTNTKGLSLIHALLICWAVYRRVIPKEKQNNQLFIDAIVKCDDERAYRRRNICPPQTHSEQRKTAIALEKMFEILLLNDNGEVETLDNLISLSLSKEGLKVTLDINPKKLHESIIKEYSNRCNHDPLVKESGGKSAKAILEVYSRSGFSDDFRLNKASSILGNNENFRCYAAGTEIQAGFVIHFGHG